MLGAEEGTRTPTPLRVHGPEPCASANSATSASAVTGRVLPLAIEEKFRVIFYRGIARCQTCRTSPLSCELDSASKRHKRCLA